MIYVDDLLLISEKMALIVEIKSKLKDAFEMADLNELHHFLGIKIERDIPGGTMQLSQTAQVQRILSRFGMEDSKPVRTPAEAKLQLPRGNGSSDHPYRELIGSLMYLMMGSRPDLCFIVGYLARFQDAAGDEHWKQAKRVLRYLQATKELKLIYRRKPLAAPLEAFADADYASDEIDRKCVSGYLLKVCGNTVAWSSKKQASVAMSSTEAEYIALSSCVSEVIWLSGLMSDVGQSENLLPVPVFEDNQGAIAMAKKEESRRAKHIDVRFHFVRDAVAEGKVKLVYVPTYKQEADVLTKALPAPAFETLRRKIGLETFN